VLLPFFKVDQWLSVFIDTDITDTAKNGLLEGLYQLTEELMKYKDDCLLKEVKKEGEEEANPDAELSKINRDIHPNQESKMAITSMAESNLSKYLISLFLVHNNPLFSKYSLQNKLPSIVKLLSSSKALAICTLEVFKTIREKEYCGNDVVNNTEEGVHSSLVEILSTLVATNAKDIKETTTEAVLAETIKTFLSQNEETIQSSSDIVNFAIKLLNQYDFLEDLIMTAKKPEKSTIDDVLYSLKLRGASTDKENQAIFLAELILDAVNQHGIILEANMPTIVYCLKLNILYTPDM